jgi:hypothetical protein
MAECTADEQEREVSIDDKTDAELQDCALLLGVGISKVDAQ